MDNEKNKSVRIRTQVGIDSKLDVHLQRDVDLMQILSLNLKQSDAYLNKSSNYGVIVGRVLANDAFGVENVKVSVFIPISDEYYIKRIRSIYPFRNVTNRNSINNTRYNLLEDYVDDECHADIGTFPNKRLLLDDNTYIEVFEKYYKFTTSTNKSGDYMIYGVPIGNQQVHIDVDLSNIGLLSQRPRDFYYKGYGQELFKNANQFKTSTNLDNLAQVFSQNKSVSVYPFWGDEENDTIAITRCDINLDYKFESTCVFMGSAITDRGTNDIGSNCLPSKKVGKNSELISGEGIIEMIRKTQDGYTEELAIKGGRLIDSDGVWCYQIPMNLDYVQTDEEGNIIPSENPNKGIATRARVRFRFSLDDIMGDGKSRHRAEYLVPNNPKVVQEDVNDNNINKIHKGLEFDGDNFETQYNFGSDTQESDFRDLLWNNVYSVKSYIPRIVNGASRKHFLRGLRETKRTFLGIKSVNHSDNNNPFPYNSFMGDLPLSYRLICNLFYMIVRILRAINRVLSIIHNINIPVIRKLTRKVKCIGVEIGDITAFVGCNGKAKTDFTKDSSNHCNEKECSADVDRVDQYVQDKLAEDFEAIDLDFGNDWINGTLYFPLWHWLKKKKKKFFFGLFSRKAVDRYCSCERGSKNSFIFHYKHAYNDVTKTNKATGSDTIKQVFMGLGLIHKHFNRDNVELYYYPSAVVYGKKMFRLFATDIILLGSLVDNDLNGVGKLFSFLPQTTAHIPPLVPERETDKSHSTNYVDTQNGTNMPYNTILVSGMDEGSRASGDGLFFGLTCNNLYPNSQGSINSIRACELGVDIDTAHYYPNIVGGNLSYKLSKADALITKVEMYNADIRAEFATYNYNPLIVSKLNKLTGYKTYDYKYMYPHNFDSCMLGKRFTTNEAYSQSYLDFRYGKAKHFYESFFGEDSNNSPFIGPIYENSFYFYFGLKEGKTAIDKFRNLFYVNCIKDEELAFNIGVKINGVGKTCRNESIASDFPSFTLDLKDASKPYELYIKDLYGEEVFRMKEINTDVLNFQQSFYLNESFGKLKEGSTDTFINNSIYKVYVKDNNNKVSKTSVDLSISPISVITETSNFKAKSKLVSPTDYDNMGKLTIDEISVDGTTFNVTSNDIRLISTPNLFIYNDDNELEAFNKDGLYQYVVSLRILGEDYVVYSEEDYNSIIEFKNGWWYVKEPRTISFAISKICHSDDGDIVLIDWQGTFGGEIADYESYKLTLNGFAIPEWVGITKKGAVNSFIGNELEMFKPSSYLMNSGTQSSISYEYWGDVIKNYNDMDTEDTTNRKLAVASYKLGSLFNICNILYVSKLVNDNTLVGYDCQSIDSEDYQGFISAPSGSDDSQQINATIMDFLYRAQNYYNVDANAPTFVSHYIRNIQANKTLSFFVINDGSLSIDFINVEVKTRNLIEANANYFRNKLYLKYNRGWGFYNCYVHNTLTDDNGKEKEIAVSPANCLFVPSTLTVRNWLSHDSYDCRLNAVLFGYQDNNSIKLSGTLYGGLYFNTDAEHNIISNDKSTTYSYSDETISYNKFNADKLNLYSMQFGDKDFSQVSLSDTMATTDIISTKQQRRDISAQTNCYQKETTLKLVNNSFDIDIEMDDDNNIKGYVNEGNEVEFKFVPQTYLDENDNEQSNYSLSYGNLGSFALENAVEDHNNLVVKNGEVEKMELKIQSFFDDNNNKVAYYAMIVDKSVTMDRIQQIIKPYQQSNNATKLNNLYKTLAQENKVKVAYNVYAVDNLISDSFNVVSDFSYFDWGGFDMQEMNTFIKIQKENGVVWNEDKVILVRRYYNEDWETTHLDHIAYVINLIPLKDMWNNELPYDKVNGNEVTKKQGYTYTYLSTASQYEEIDGSTFDVSQLPSALGKVFIAENNETGEKIKVKITD